MTPPTSWGRRESSCAAGHHCAQPVHDRFGLSASLRVSLSFYNTTAEIDFFVKKLKELHQAFK